MRKHSIDPINYVHRKVETADGLMELEGMTVRALIKALQQCDPDDLVVYMAEMLPEMKDIKLLIGVIGGVLSQGNNQTSFMVGPEAVRALHEKGMVE